MEQEVTNYARFYALLKKLPGADKETLVYQFTGGRTKSLRQMSEKEYESMCNEMERVAGCDERREAYRRELRRKRSAPGQRLLPRPSHRRHGVPPVRHRRAGGAGREMPRHPPQAARERSQRTTFKLTTL